MPPEINTEYFDSDLGGAKREPIILFTGPKRPKIPTSENSHHRGTAICRPRGQ